ncbi:hypothetical protein [Silanimonas sp.]|uniref:hypothetical protein n=1 Tax=Silanimonas sp. TaxID=1929290 RepID=UPI0037CB5966
MNRIALRRTAAQSIALGAALVAGLATASDYRNFSIGSGFTPDPQTGTGTTGGARDAAQAFGGQCSGSIDTTPDHVITVTSAVNLKLYTTSTTDSTLVMRGPSGTFCDDDSRGELDAEINAMLRPAATRSTSATLAKRASTRSPSPRTSVGPAVAPATTAASRPTATSRWARASPQTRSAAAAKPVARAMRAASARPAWAPSTPRPTIASR